MYSIKSRMQPYLVSDSAGVPMFWHIHDKPAGAGGQKLLEGYLRDALAIYKSELEILMSTDRSFLEKDEERLIVMLKLLIDARKTWQEEEIAACAPVPPRAV